MANGGKSMKIHGFIVVYGGITMVMFFLEIMIYDSDSLFASLVIHSGKMNG